MVCHPWSTRCLGFVACPGSTQEVLESGRQVRQTLHYISIDKFPYLPPLSPLMAQEASCADPQRTPSPALHPERQPASHPSTLPNSPRNVTASRPSSRRWSYVSATTIIGRISILPSTTTGRSLIACMPDPDHTGQLSRGQPLHPTIAQQTQCDLPSTAAWGRLIIGVPYMLPNTPPFELS